MAITESSESASTVKRSIGEPSGPSSSSDTGSEALRGHPSKTEIGEPLTNNDLRIIRNSKRMRRRVTVVVLCVCVCVCVCVCPQP